ncbi:hypothetical protein PHMEG_000921 [Phytophthora megakarya]|uniref:Uncharacterized protein n=1 Tax=Phytophthora megakarya TaxID=4795 RepID=A0A225X4G7_9STRA|nr:hypothetical protein PHMEG_000921 [Phytophthora megakarya]
MKKTTLTTTSSTEVPSDLPELEFLAFLRNLTAKINIDTRDDTADAAARANVLGDVDEEDEEDPSEAGAEGDNEDSFTIII